MTEPVSVLAIENIGRDAERLRCVALARRSKAEFDNTSDETPGVLRFREFCDRFIWLVESPPQDETTDEEGDDQ